jgi:hypothetical protein
MEQEKKSDFSIWACIRFFLMIGIALSVLVALIYQAFSEGEYFLLGIVAFLIPTFYFLIFVDSGRIHL